LTLARNKLLTCLKKRDLLNNDKADTSELISIGKQYSLEGRFSDAIDFFEKAEHIEELDQLKERCIEEGDFFLFNRLISILADSPSPDEWSRLGEKALALGKLHFARSAYTQANLPEKVAQIEKLLELPLQDKSKAKSSLH
jgi:tetratricopeptide (TPR) repeat protein